MALGVFALFLSAVKPCIWDWQHKCSDADGKAMSRRLTQWITFPVALTLLVDYLACNPTAGVRKLRWRLEGRGKRGGARVIYFHRDAGMPLLVEAFKRRRP